MALFKFGGGAILIDTWYAPSLASAGAVFSAANNDFRELGKIICVT